MGILIRWHVLHLIFLAATNLVWGAPTPTQRSLPWWSVPFDFEVVSPDYSWVNRRTGITNYWKPALGIWSHFRPDGLERCPSVPWTSGRMCKSLRQLNVSAFELHSVYEPNALGLWFRGVLDPNNPNRPDGLLQHAHTFIQSDFRVLPMAGGIDIPSEEYAAPAGYNTSRVTIVQPNSATFSGPRWLPSSDVARSCKSGKYCEMWLAESIDNTEPEDRKLGLFLEYDQQTGELIQFFRMNERSLKHVDASFDPRRSSSPEMINSRNVDLGAMQDSLSELPLDFESPTAKALIAGDPIENIIEKGEWTLCRARMVKADSLTGPEVAIEADLSNQLPKGWWNPQILLEGERGATDINPNYWNCRFEDGSYARVPKVIHPDMDEICFEFGCLMTEGRGIHRLIAMGSRKEGSLHTLIYEQWGPAIKDP